MKASQLKIWLAIPLLMIVLFGPLQAAPIEGITYQPVDPANETILVLADLTDASYPRARADVGSINSVSLPSAVWLFGSALIGFIGMSRRTGV